MIYGIGTDIVHVKRMHDNLEKYGDKFARRILTDAEFSEFQDKNNKTAFLAKRFAAKECWNLAVPQNDLSTPGRLIKVILVSLMNVTMPLLLLPW